MPHTTLAPKVSEASIIHQSATVGDTPETIAELDDDGSPRLSILVVDDEPTVRLLIRTAMEKEGFRVIEADNGLACLQRFNQARPDMVLLDAVMPEMDGFSCCAALQDLAEKWLDGSKAPAVPPILMITSLDDSSSVEQAFAAGATDYVTKPIHWALLRHRVRGIRDSIRRQQADAQIKQSLKEKEALLKEVHHRVKNNLQIISSLLSLQASTLKDETVLGYFQESQNRVRLMAMVHEKLYQSKDLGEIELASYVQELSCHLLRSYGLDQEGICLSIHIDNIFLDADAAVSCGLIINELISNSLKYAFPKTATRLKGKKSKIEIEARPMSNGHFFICYRDNGVGLPEDFEIETATTLGLQLVSSLTEQLGGVLTVAKGTATEFRLSQLLLSR